MYKKIKIGITGSTGILGTELIKKFQNKRYDLLKFRNDIASSKKVSDWIKKNQFDIIIHLAAIVPTELVKKNFKKAININVNGTKNIIYAIKKYQKKKIYLFFSSTSHVYNFSKKIILENAKYHGISKYGKTKIGAEKLLIKNGKNYNLCIGRIASLTSEKQKKYSFLKNIILKLKKGKKINFGNSNIYRNFIHPKDISNAIYLLIKKRITGIYNISTKEKTQFTKIFKNLNKKFGNLIIYKSEKKQKLLLSTQLLRRKIKWKNKITTKIIIKKILTY